MRAIRIDLSTPVEAALRKARDLIEEMPPDHDLTQASIDVTRALEIVSRWQDDQIRDALGAPPTDYVPPVPRL